MPLVRLAKPAGKAEARFKPESQDTGLIALVWIVRGFAPATVRFSDKEKDEASPGICFVRGLWNAFILPLCGFEGFFMPANSASGLET